MNDAKPNPSVRKVLLLSEGSLFVLTIFQVEDSVELKGLAPKVVENILNSVLKVSSRVVAIDKSIFTSSKDT